MTRPNTIERWECPACDFAATYPAPWCARTGLLESHPPLVHRTYVAADLFDDEPVLLDHITDDTDEVRPADVLAAVLTRCGRIER